MKIIPTVTYPGNVVYSFYEQRNILQEIAMGLMRPWTDTVILEDDDLEFQVFNSLTSSLSSSETIEVFNTLIKKQKHRLSFLISGSITTNMVVTLDITPVTSKQLLMRTLTTLSDIKTNNIDPFHLLLQPVWVSRQRTNDSFSPCLQIAECDIGAYEFPEQIELENSYRVVVFT